MKIVTVNGDVSLDNVGVILPHEHVIVDNTIYWIKPKDPREKKLAEEKVSLSNLREVLMNEFLVKDNLLFTNVNDAVNAAQLYKEAGGDVLVDATPDGVGRNPKGLLEVSQRTGVKIIAGAGYYVELSHPEYIKKWTVDRIKEEIVKDLTVGIGDTRIKAGVIGEIGTVDSKPTPVEAKVLKAAAKAQAETGAGVLLHARGLGRIDSPKASLDILEGLGVDLEKVAVAHRDSLLGHLRREDYLKQFDRIVERGPFLSFDCFGMEGYFRHSGTHAERDWKVIKYSERTEARIKYSWLPFYNISKDIERVEAIMDLIQRGHIKKCLLSHDTFFKIHHRKYGGFGWGHILEEVVPMLRAAGATQRHIDILLKENPKRFLAF